MDMWPIDHNHVQLQKKKNSELQCLLAKEWASLMICEYDGTFDVICLLSFGAKESYPFGWCGHMFVYKSDLATVGRDYCNFQVKTQEGWRIKIDSTQHYR